MKNIITYSAQYKIIPQNFQNNPPRIKIKIIQKIQQSRIKKIIKR